MEPDDVNSSGPAIPPAKRSMHEDVEIWEDCCVCEPEPRWQALAEEMERADQQAHAPPTAPASPPEQGQSPPEPATAPPNRLPRGE